MRIGSLCTGYGGLELAVRAVLGAELAWYAEHEPATPQHPRPTQAASRLLAHHYPDLLNLGDLTIVDWEAAARVDILTAGWPCQPWSLAGRRAGAGDARAIWPYVAAAVRALRPRLVFLENVPAIVRAGELARVVASLAALGYVGSWVCVRASDVGAPHRRDRIFILASPVRDTDGIGGEGWPTAGLEGQTGSAARPAADTEDVGHERGWVSRRRGTGPADGRGLAADTSGDRWREGRSESARVIRGSDAAQRDHAAADPDGDGFEGLAEHNGQAYETGGATEARRGHAHGSARPAVMDWAGYTPAIRRWEHVLGRPAPTPTVLGLRGARALSSLFVEWLMGLPEGHVTAVPGLSRTEQLKLLGNGVVPHQAEHALRLLLPALEEFAA